jgi:hypothetical protein
MSIKRRLIYVLIVALAFMGLAVTGVLPLSVMGIAPGDFDVNSERYQFHTWEGKGALTLDQLSDSSHYVSGKVSEKVVVAAQIQKHSLSFQVVTDMKYVYTFTTGNVWGEPDRVYHPTQTSSGVGWIVIKTDIWNFLPAASGYLRVQFFIELSEPWGSLGWGLVAQDDSYVVRGDGSVAWTAGQYVVGQEAVADYTVGYARSAKTEDALLSEGWTVSVYSGAQERDVINKVIPGPAPGGSPDATVSDAVKYMVTDADFALTDSCAVATSRNFLRVTIFNNLVSTAMDKATTVDVLSLAPPIPGMTLDKSAYEIGDSITIQLTASPNAETNLPICGIHLKVAYRTLSSQPLVDIDLAGDASEYTYFSLPDAGLLIIEAYSFDAGSRNSDMAEGSVDVKDPTSEPEGVSVFLVVLAMVVMFIVAILILLPIPGLVNIPLKVRGIISTVLLGSVVGMLIIFFVVPAACAFLSAIFGILGFSC